MATQRVGTTPARSHQWPSHWHHQWKPTYLIPYLPKPKPAKLVGGVGARFHNASPSKLRQYLPRFAIFTAALAWSLNKSAIICHNTMANKLQRSAGVKCSCNLSQGKHCQIPWATPLVLYCIVLSLALPKLHLASLTIIYCNVKLIIVALSQVELTLPIAPCILLHSVQLP